MTTTHHCRRRIVFWWRISQSPVAASRRSMRCGPASCAARVMCQISCGLAHLRRSETREQEIYADPVNEIDRNLGDIGTRAIARERGDQPADRTIVRQDERRVPELAGRRIDVAEAREVIEARHE